MKENFTDITVLIDQSGSMNERVSEVIGGFNSFLKTHKKASGDANISLILFDSVNPQEVVYSAKPVRQAPNLTADTFRPRGGTPLYDAFGLAITATGQRLAALPESERPSRVIFVVITDGFENMSREYSASMVKSVVKHQTEKYSWDFIFLGADMDAMAQGAQIGIVAGSTVPLTSNNFVRAFNLTAAKTAAYRSTNNKADLGYTVTERDSLMDKEGESR